MSASVTPPTLRGDERRFARATPPPIRTCACARSHAHTHAPHLLPRKLGVPHLPVLAMRRASARAPPGPARAAFPACHRRMPLTPHTRTHSSDTHKLAIFCIPMRGHGTPCRALALAPSACAVASQPAALLPPSFVVCLCTQCQSSGIAVCPRRSFGLPWCWLPWVSGAASFCARQQVALQGCQARVPRAKQRAQTKAGRHRRKHSGGCCSVGNVPTRRSAQSAQGLAAAHGRAAEQQGLGPLQRRERTRGPKRLGDQLSQPLSLAAHSASPASP